MRVSGVQRSLWRVVGHEGEVLEAFLSNTGDKQVALTFLRKLMKRHGRSEALVTGKLRSHGAALKELGAGGCQATRQTDPLTTRGTDPSC